MTKKTSKKTLFSPLKPHGYRTYLIRLTFSEIRTSWKTQKKEKYILICLFYLLLTHNGFFLKKKKKKLHKFLHCVLSKNRLWQEILVTILYFIGLDYIFELNSHL